jgi:uncharacterized protein HemY
MKHPRHIYAFFGRKREKGRMQRREGAEERKEGKMSAKTLSSPYQR